MVRDEQGEPAESHAHFLGPMECARGFGALRTVERCGAEVERREFVRVCGAAARRRLPSTVGVAVHQQARAEHPRVGLRLQLARKHLRLRAAPNGD
eukprot:5889887-Pleurochrysis_carterae.AAC.2